MYHSRINHWSCSKLSDKIRGTKKPASFSMEEWENWDDYLKKNNPIRFWISENGLRLLQDIVYFPYDRYRDIRSYVRNRFIDKIHALTASPEHLKRGQYCDIDTRMFYCLFDTLVDFVEGEVAHWTAWNDHDKKYTWKNGRCKDAGLDHLKWEMTLTDSEYGLFPDSPEFAKPTSQAIAAKEIFDLYIWYTEVYANRKDPMDESGWSDYCSTPNWSNKVDPEDRIILDKCNKLEEAYDNEDTEMLIRLIKIRQALWT